MSREQLFNDKNSLRKWLITAAGVAITSISLISSIQTLDYQFRSPTALSVIMDSYPQAFPEGSYLVKFENTQNDEADALDYTKMAMAISLEAMPVNKDYLIGGLQPLLDNLVDFEFFSATDRTNPHYITASIWVVEPKSPVELEKLKRVLDEYSVMYAFNDSSGFITLNNARMGRGVQKLVKAQPSRVGHL